MKLTVKAIEAGREQLLSRAEVAKNCARSDDFINSLCDAAIETIEMHKVAEGSLTQEWDRVYGLFMDIKYKVSELQKENATLRAALSQSEGEDKD
jgi:hypothetical protein